MTRGDYAYSPINGKVHKLLCVARTSLDQTFWMRDTETNEMLKLKSYEMFSTLAAAKKICGIE